jgi:glyoxylase-like metal-dependent hydrolase (beta-lactamase superfamily II)
MMDGAAEGLGAIRHPLAEPPAPGAAIPLAEGVLWMRLPLPMVLNHVNIFALDDGVRGWTVIDTGADNPGARETWARLLAGPLGGRPVWRVLVTHYHPDHVGLAALLIDRGAELWCTRTTYLMTRMLIADLTPEHSQRDLDFWREAGLDAETFARRLAEPPFNFSRIASQLPPGFRRIAEGDRIEAAGRSWRVHCGEGHAPEQATLWDEAGKLVISADQALPSISPNLSVYPAEPMADPVGDWIESCARLAGFATEAQLVLPGHKLPFTGLPRRLAEMAEHHQQALDRMVAHISEPKVAADCFAPLFKREITPEIYGMALGETVAHLNRLLAAGRASRERRADGAWLWRAA